MEKVATLITRWFIDKNILPAEDEELYVYAVSCLLITVSPLFLILVLGACLDLVMEGIAIIIPFMIIRTFSGGIHSGSSRSCFFISLGMLSALLMLTKVISNSYMLCISMLGASISLSVCSPIENENKQLNINEKKIYKKITVVWVIIFCVIYFLLGFFGKNEYSVCVALGIILTAVLQVPCLSNKWKQI